MVESPIEFWKKHPYIVGVEASSFGNVRTLDSVVSSEKRTYYRRGGCCKKYRDKYGYLVVSITINGKQVNKKVHRLVAEVFIPNPNNLSQLNHKNGDRTNNSVSNLEFCTSSYNSKYRMKFGESLEQPVFAVDLCTLEVCWFQSKIKASRALGVDRKNIYNTIKGKQKQTKGYWFVDADDKAVESTRQKFDDEVADRVKELIIDKEAQTA